MPKEKREYALREVVAELTSRCNLSCLHCGSDCQLSLNEKELSIAEWKTVINQLSEMEVKKIHFSGGEPTLKKGFSEIISHTAGKIRYSVITNAFSIGPEIIELFQQHKPFTIGISFDGLQETHDQIRNKYGSWKQAVLTIMNLKEAGIQVCAITTVSRLNYPQLFELANTLTMLEVDSWQLQLVMPFGRADKNQGLLLINEEIFRKVCMDVYELRKKNPQLNIVAADCFGWAPKDFIRPDEWSGCGAGLVALGLDAFGNILPCLSLKSGVSDCPNIREKSIEEIWSHSDIFDFNRNFNPKKVQGKCGKCDGLKSCRGGCASQSLSHNGYFHCSPYCFYRSFLTRSS